ncbi:MAG: uroporphyrinogen decarboxylase family protein [Promethearchaeati archaeon SRVP18_Atabeyarchaeia-1]
MKPRERLITVLEKHEPDCIPIVLQSIISSNVSNELMRITSRSRARDSSSVDGGITFQKVREFSDRIARVNPSNWKKEFEKIANSASRAPIDVNVYARLGVDGFFYPSTPGQIRILDQKHFVNEFGSTWEFGDANGELINWYKDGCLKTPEQRDRWPLPKPEAERVRSYQEALKIYGERVYPIGFVVGIFELTWQSMGFTEFARNLKTNASFVHRVYEEHAKFAEELAKLFLDAGAEIIGIGDDVAYKNNLMVSPKMWSEFVQPLASRIVNTIHKRGGLVFMHSDGYITPLIDLIIRTGYDGIQSLEPLAGVRLAEVKEKYGDRIALIGGIDTSQLLPFGTEKDVEKAVRDAIKAAGMKGGYGIGPCTEIHWKCRPQNVVAMVKYARKYGNYPLQVGGSDPS